MRRLLGLLLAIPLIAGCGGGSSASVSHEIPAAGGTAALSDAVTIQFPEGAVPDGTKVTITEGGGPEDKLEAGESLGSAFDIDLGGQQLSKPVTIEIAYDPEKLPDGSSPEQAFLAFYDEQKRIWIPVAGDVDTQRNVIIIQTDHLSWWNPFSWNWGAWLGVLENALTGNVTDFFQAVALLTDDCPQSGTTVAVDSSEANNVVQGCVEKDDPSSPELRVVNPKSFFFEVKPLSGGNDYPPQTMLGPGEDVNFQAATSDPAPLVVQAEISQRAGLYLIVHLVIQMLPGLNELGIQGSQIGCITEKVSDVSHFISASEALLVGHDGTAAAEQLLHFLADGDAVRRFITAASDCNYGAAPTWSVEGIQQIGSAAAAIISAVDFAANYLLNQTSQISFTWRTTPHPVTAVGAFLSDCGSVPGSSCDLGYNTETKITINFDLSGGTATGIAHGDSRDLPNNLGVLTSGSGDGAMCVINVTDIQLQGSYDPEAKELTGTATIRLQGGIEVGGHVPDCEKVALDQTSTSTFVATLGPDGRTLDGALSTGQRFRAIIQ